MVQFLQEQKQAISIICEYYKVSQLYVFGSILTNHFNETSDIDFLVTFNEGIELEQYAEYYFGLKFALEDLLGRDIDLVESITLRNKYFIVEIDNTKQILYESESFKVSA